VSRKRGSKKIIDVPFSRKKHLGTKATFNNINYIYQDVFNIIKIFTKLREKGELQDVLFFNTPTNCLLKIDIINKKVITPHMSIYNFKNELKKLIKKSSRFIPINIMAELGLNEYGDDMGNHANSIIIDKNSKTIEFFEPHGYKKKFSTPSDHVSVYLAKYNILKEFLKKIIPKYKLVNASDVLKKRVFQRKYDSGTGYCVIWSTLFIHYRILNPDVPIIELMDHIDKTINVNKLLKYAKYTEDLLKNKI
tara:strand:- start:835 stop:1584 length:750 start_codon:yes stop_codon:yes gene_type:complete